MGENFSISNAAIFMPNGTKIMDLTDAVTTISPETECHDVKSFSITNEVSGTFTFDYPCTNRGLTRLYRMLLGRLIPKELKRRRQIEKAKRMMKCSFSK